MTFKLISSATMSTTLPTAGDMFTTTTAPAAGCNNKQKAVNSIFKMMQALFAGSKVEITLPWAIWVFSSTVRDIFSFLRRSGIWVQTTITASLKMSPAVGGETFH